MPGDHANADGRFPTTRWSAIAGARSADGAERERSWSALVRAYWKPAYKHLRVRWRASPEDAEDAIQGFFERAMQKDFFAAYDPGRARFRTFFRVCLERFVSNEVKARARLKRGGAAAAWPLEFAAAEEEIARAGVAAWESPEDCFEREWRRGVFALAVEALRAHCELKGKGSCFAAFQRYDLCEPAERPTYDALAADLGVAATTVTNHLAYARRELRRLVLEMLAEITASEAELSSESRFVFGEEGG
jgi:RNA polymerase sigma factor (sigma-70 family)